MNKQYVRLEFGKGSVICDCVLSLDCPNFCGGIGNIHIHTAENDLWSGEVHLIGSVFQFAFGNIKRICTRDTLCEHEGGPWVEVWKYTEPFTYEQYYHAASLLRKIMAENIQTIHKKITLNM
jgi:hypothetical protein